MSALQQINLLTDDLLPRREVFTDRQLLAGCALFAVLLCLLSLWDGWSLAKVRQQADTAARQLARLDAQLAELRKSQEGGEQAMRAELERLREQRAAQAMLAQVLSEDGDKTRNGVAAAMVSLAESVVSGLWLQEIRIYPQRLHLKGSALDAVLVPRYLQNIADGDRFDGLRFSSVEVSGSGSGGIVEFELKSPQPPGGGR